jgi:hypothetical protein
MYVDESTQEGVVEILLTQAELKALSHTLEHPAIIGFTADVTNRIDTPGVTCTQQHGGRLVFEVSSEWCGNPVGNGQFVMGLLRGTYGSLLTPVAKPIEQ